MRKPTAQPGGNQLLRLTWQLGCLLATLQQAVHPGASTNGRVPTGRKWHPRVPAVPLPPLSLWTLEIKGWPVGNFTKSGPSMEKRTTEALSRQVWHAYTCRASCALWGWAGLNEQNNWQNQRPSAETGGGCPFYCCPSAAVRVQQFHAKTSCDTCNFHIFNFQRKKICRHLSTHVLQYIAPLGWQGFQLNWGKPKLSCPKDPEKHG